MKSNRHFTRRNFIGLKDRQPLEPGSCLPCRNRWPPGRWRSRICWSLSCRMAASYQSSGFKRTWSQSGKKAPRIVMLFFPV